MYKFNQVAGDVAAFEVVDGQLVGFLHLLLGAADVASESADYSPELFIFCAEFGHLGVQACDVSVDQVYGLFKVCMAVAGRGLEG